jgi:hypothetical protein
LSFSLTTINHFNQNLFSFLRLLSWLGQQIEPHGIDFILNKLGFSHARPTLAKRFKRGFLDILLMSQREILIFFTKFLSSNQKIFSLKKVPSAEKSKIFKFNFYLYKLFTKTLFPSLSSFYHHEKLTHVDCLFFINTKCFP